MLKSAMMYLTCFYHYNSGCGLDLTYFSNWALYTTCLIHPFISAHFSTPSAFYLTSTYWGSASCVIPLVCRLEKPVIKPPTFQWADNLHYLLSYRHPNCTATICGPNKSVKKLYNINIIWVKFLFTVCFFCWRLCKNNNLRNHQNRDSDQQPTD